MAAAAMHGVEAAGQGMARVRPGFGRDRARDGRRGEAGAGGEADGGGWPEQGRGARGTRDPGRYTHARGEEVPDLGRGSRIWSPGGGGRSPRLPMDGDAGRSAWRAPRELASEAPLDLDEQQPDPWKRGEGEEEPEVEWRFWAARTGDGAAAAPPPASSSAARFPAAARGEEGREGDGGWRRGSPPSRPSWATREP